LIVCEAPRLQQKVIPHIDKKYFIVMWFYFTLKRLKIAVFQDFKEKCISIFDLFLVKSY
jgi:hypothetical protein